MPWLAALLALLVATSVLLGTCRLLRRARDDRAMRHRMHDLTTAAPRFALLDGQAPAGAAAAARRLFRAA